MFCYIKLHSWDQILLLYKHGECEHKKRLNFCTQYKISTALCDFIPKCRSWRIVDTVKVLHRNSTVARRVTNVTSEHYGSP